jgi:hypothetical protein
MVEVARLNGLWYVCHPHNPSHKVSLDEPLINESCCSDLIDETFVSTTKRGFKDGIEASRATQQVLPHLKPFPMNLTDHSEGQSILSKIFWKPRLQDGGIPMAMARNPTRF